ncbi:NACHT, LRR and PYD domains-containing protein 3-like isoform X2 [Leucoraja erinacea]|nr:NACHT, LRR and PYD domains-containing protein 3-like isoform X2 [Leucoraja erinacea]
MCVCIRREVALNKFTDLWIVESNARSWQQEASDHLVNTPIHPLSCSEILQPANGGDRLPRTAITKGIAGIGKTACVEKIIYDWAAGSILSEFDFIFMFPFYKLNMLPQKALSLEQLIQFCYPHIQSCKQIFSSTSIKCLYIFDGLDESRQTLDFENQLACYDECESRSLESLLSNLIRGNIHPSSSVWITTRPAAMGQTPPSFIDRLTEIQGFRGREKVEYFRNKYENGHLAAKMISVVKTESSLSLLCFLPAFCSVLSTYLEDALKSFSSHEPSDYMPIATTPVFNKFLAHTLFLLQHRQAYLRGAKQTFAEMMKSKQSDIMSLGKLSFDLLRGQTYKFSEKVLRTYNVDVSMVESGFCRELGKENGNNIEKIFAFVQGALQEYFAALHVFLSFNNMNYNPLMTSTKSKVLHRHEKPSYFHVLKQACEETIQSSNGHLDLFLRFLCGLGTKTNQQSLKGLMTGCEIQHDDATRIIQFLKQKLQKDIPPEKCLTLLLCLIELDDNSFVVQISKMLSTGAATYQTLSPLDYSALALVLQRSGQKSEIFNLSEHKITSIGLRRLAPVLPSFTSLKLNGSNLGDSGVKVLSEVIKSPVGKLLNLELERNDLTHRCCEILAIIVSSNRMLRNLSLRDNHLGDKGMCLLSATLKNTECRIQRLNLTNNDLSTGSWEELVSVLTTNQMLQELDVGSNRMGKAGLRILSTALKDSRCRLQKLGLNNSSTFDFGMMGSYLEETGVEVLCDVLRSPNCTLTCLELASNNLTQKNYKELTSAMRVNRTLTHLDLSSNVIQDTGMNVLSMALMDPSCSIQSLRFSDTKLTPTCCEKLANVLITNQTLRELDLSMNALGDSGVQALSIALKNPRCQLETLGLKQTSLTDGCCNKLMAALCTTQTIACLDLSENSFTDCSIRSISSLILTCGTLVDLGLEQNQFTTNGQTMIKQLNMKKPNVKIVLESVKKC